MGRFQVAKTIRKEFRRGQTNIARDLVIYSMRQHSRQTLQQIGAHLDMENYSSVSSAVQRIKAHLKNDMELSKLIENIGQKLSKVKSRLDP